MENTSLDLLPDAVDELLAQHHHRLLSLEADLKDRAKTRRLIAKVYTKS